MLTHRLLERFLDSIISSVLSIWDNVVDGGLVAMEDIHMPDDPTQRIRVGEGPCTLLNFQAQDHLIRCKMTKLALTASGNDCGTHQWVVCS
jgi:hypothetical protein